MGLQRGGPFGQALQRCGGCGKIPAGIGRCLGCGAARDELWAPPAPR